MLNEQLLSLCGRQSERVARSLEIDLRLVLRGDVLMRKEVLVDVDMLLLLVDALETLLFLLGDDGGQRYDALRSAADGAYTLGSSRGWDEGRAILLPAPAELDVVGELDAVVSWCGRIGATLLVESDLPLLVVHDVGGRSTGLGGGAGIRLWVASRGAGERGRERERWASGPGASRVGVG